jgi:hypothetical protein
MDNSKMDPGIYGIRRLIYFEMVRDTTHCEFRQLCAEPSVLTNGVNILTH